MKKTRTTMTALALAGVLTLGAAAATVQQQITATLRPDITVTVDGKKQHLTSQDGGEVSPIMYNGTTYLPVRAVSEALDMDVDWDQKTQTVSLTTPSAGTQTPTEKPPAQGGSSYQSRIDALDGRVDKLEDGTWSWNTYRQIDRDIDTLDNELERAYRNGEISYSKYQTLDNNLDVVDNRLDRLEDIHENDTNTNTDTTVSQSNKSYQNRINALSNRVDALEKGTWNWNSYHQLDRDIDAMDDELERAYRNGTLSADQYRTLDNSLDAVDNRLDRLDDLHDNDYDDDWDD